MYRRSQVAAGRVTQDSDSFDDSDSEDDPPEAAAGPDATRPSPATQRSGFFWRPLPPIANLFNLTGSFNPGQALNGTPGTNRCLAVSRCGILHLGACHPVNVGRPLPLLPLESGDLLCSTGQITRGGFLHA